MKLWTVLRSHLPFLLILLIALFFRLNRISVLTTFGRDQGIDFLTVKKMIVEHKPTLLGIKVSIADFHQGPVYLYMLTPLFFLMNLDPIAGAYTAVLVSMATVVLLYFTVHKFFDKTSALTSCLLFAVSPEFIREGNSPLYQHFLPLFLICALYALLSFLETKKVIHKFAWSLCMGIALGISLELHFLAITFAAALFILLLIQRPFKLQYVISYFIGIGIGVIPTVLFELKHQFLNTKLFFAYLTSPHSNQTSRNILDFFSPWITGLARYFGADYLLIGWMLLAAVIAAIIFIRFKKSEGKTLHYLLIITIVISVLFQFLLTGFEAHYALPIWTLLVILLPLWLAQLKNEWRLFFSTLLGLLILLNVGHVIQMSRTNHGYYMPNGWSLQKIEKATQIITDDTHNLSGINIASLLDGDTRAYPLRYTLSRANFALESEEAYPQSNMLYVVSAGGRDSVMSSEVWEISSLRPFTMDQHWDLGDGIELYRLDKQ